MTLHAKPATLGRNEELRFTVSLRNGGPSAVGFYRGRDWVDLWIYRGDEFIWTKSKAGGFYTREALIESLAPGDSRAEDVTWDQSSNCPGAPPTVTAGRYFARASLKVETASGTVTWWSEAIQFTIRP